jgi:kynurenine formamidase
MRVVDLSHPFSEDMPLYPGGRPPELRQARTVGRDGYAEKRVAFSTHTGTHIDAPAHMLAGAPTLDRLGLDHFVGPARILEVAGMQTIPKAFLEARAAELEGCAFVLFHTGWDRHWGSAPYFQGFPVLALAAAEWLGARGLKGVGFDACSVDAVASTTYEIHFALFRAGLISIENLRGLGPLAGQRVLFSCLPLNWEDADGCPVRAVALLD